LDDGSVAAGNIKLDGQALMLSVSRADWAERTIELGRARDHG
jgi:hypothetical protein